jgi:hypothetical protein
MPPTRWLSVTVGFQALQQGFGVVQKFKVGHGVGWVQFQQ